MADEHDSDEEESTDEPSFKERLEQAREEAEAGDDPMAGLGGGGMGGNPFAQMMGGMMGGGPGGGMQQEARESAVAMELGQLREDIKELTDQLERIADSLEE